MSCDIKRDADGSVSVSCGRKSSPLYKESGGDDAQRSSEAIRLLDMIDDAGLVSPSDIKFVSDCRERLEKYGATKFWISPKQLFWLRDIKDRQI